MDKLLQNKDIVAALSQHLPAQDLSELATTSHASHEALTTDDTYKSKCAFAFGDLFGIYGMFKSTPVEVTMDVAKQFGTSPSNWRVYYEEKRRRLAEQQFTNHDWQQIDAEVNHAMQELDRCPEQGDILLFNHLLPRTLWILDRVPGHGPCYYILAKMLYFLQHDQLHDVIVEGTRLAPDYQPLRQLKITIDEERWMTPFVAHHDAPQSHHPHHHLLHPDAATTDADLFDTSALSAALPSPHRRRSSVKVPLPVLDHDDTALSEPLRRVLDELFTRFDTDADDALCPHELDAFVFATNGQHPGDEWLDAFSLRFGANDNGWLTRDGLMVHGTH
ncbi:hypothetical protein BC940DRAFT_286981 [Gongronella butleri]|nr:hypothetical protein BC940DRAFT_286981 [Gongronella butleri]